MRKKSQILNKRFTFSLWKLVYFLNYLFREIRPEFGEQNHFESNKCRWLQYYKASLRYYLQEQNLITMSSFQKGSKLDRNKKQSANPFNEQNWIGSDVVPEAAPQPSHSLQRDNRILESIDKKDEPRSQPKAQIQARTIKPVDESRLSKGFNVGQKSPMELMQDILKGVREGEQLRPYYSKQAEQTLTELLTNKFKLNNYVKKLESDMVGLDSRAVKNYQVLVLLLQQVSNADVEIKYGDSGMDIKFNRSIIQRQQAQIQKLEKQKQQKEKQIKYIIESYESIILDFNDVIEKLVNRQQTRYKQKF